MPRHNSNRPTGLCMVAPALSLLLACGNDDDTTSDQGAAPGQPCGNEGATAAANDGCNTCECTMGAWACTEIACTGDGDGPCTDADTKPADDGCNTCTCEAGEWRCTARDCITCPDPAQKDGVCDTVVVYARDPDSALCCEYGTPCNAPDGWEQFFTVGECEGAGDADQKWYTSCGAPVCGPGSDVPTGATLCGDQVEGEPCEDEGGMCDPGAGCGVNLVCAAEDPKMQPGGCPISRARFKRDIEYLSAARRAQLAQDLLALPLATWRYRQGDVTERLGFIIEDVEPSPSVDSARDRVDLYGYTTMAVAALQEQHRELAALRAEVAALRAAVHSGSLCEPAPRGTRAHLPTEEPMSSPGREIGVR